MGWRPNWKNPDEYPDPTKTSDIQWAWEFLRRNKDYQKDYQNRNDIVMGNLLPDDICQKYGLHPNSAFPDPASNNPGEADYDDGVAFINPIRFRGSVLSVVKPEFDETTGRYHSEVYGDHDMEVYVRFDLSVPLKQQVDNVKESLYEMQKRLNIKPSYKKQDFVRYLRILDALYDEAQNKEIARILYSDIKTVSKKEDYPGQNKIKNATRAAIKLMKEDYILLGSSKYPY